MRQLGITTDPPDNDERFLVDFSRQSV